MEDSSSACKHPDIRKFDGVRCCLSCGLALFEQEKPKTIDTESPSKYTCSAPYTYKRLNYELGQEVRLLRLFAGNPSEEIFCDLVHVNLLDKPEYEALSYTWATETGESSLSRNIYCQGRTIAVTKNCQTALRNLRYKSGIRMLWVDAICINQQHVSERNHQVSLMSDIYSQASRVLAFIGEGSTGINGVFDYLNGYDTLESTNCDWESFLKARWFSRAWVLQEVALAKQVVLISGHRTVDWTNPIIQEVLTVCNIWQLEIPGVLQWKPDSEILGDWLLALYRSRNCEVGDARDKIFAIRSLMNKSAQQLVPVDYSLSKEEIYTNLATHLIEQNGSMDVLKYCVYNSKAADQISSWVPLWSEFNHTILPPQFTDEQVEYLSSSWFDIHSPAAISRVWSDLRDSATNEGQPSVESCIEIADSSPLISMDGFPMLVTRNKYQGLRYEILPNPGAATSAKKILRVKAHRLGQLQPTRFQRTKRLFRTDVAEKHLELEELLGPNVRLCLACSQQGHISPFLEKDKHMVYNPRALGGLEEMQWIYTEDSTGYTLKSSKVDGMRPGIRHFKLEYSDTVWAIDGASTPFILRQVPGTENQFRLIIQCHLFGVLSPHLRCNRCGHLSVLWMKSQIIDIV